MAPAVSSDEESKGWHPKTFVQFVRHIATSTGPAEIETDAGRAMLKALGNKEGPHVLACEWVGTSLAAWFGLPTFDMVLLRIEPEDEIPLGHGRSAQPGTAIAFRWERGHTWGAKPVSLQRIDNPADISRLVVFDTWVRNCDRHPPNPETRRPNRDNVFFSEEGAAPGRFILKAIDHTHCLTCGRPLDKRVARIHWVKDAGLYGLFPEFVPLLDRARVKSAAARLRELDGGWVRKLLASLPTDWEISKETREAVAELVCQRAVFVADTIVDKLAIRCNWGLDFPEPEEDVR